MNKKSHPKPRKGQKAGVAHARKIGGKYYAKVKAGKFSGGTHFVMRPVKAASVKKARAAKRRKK